MPERSSLTHKKIVLKARQQGYRVAVTGARFICTECAAKFEIALGDREKIPMELGLKVTVTEPGELFTAITFYSLTDEDQTIEFYAGTADIDDYRLNTLLERQIAVGYRALPTDVIGFSDTDNPGGITSIDTLDTISVPEKDGRRRKHVIVTNKGNDDLDSADIEIRDSAERPVLPVFVRTSVIVETTDTIHIYNPNAGSVSIVIGEVYYSVE